MTKQVCDICGKEMSTTGFTDFLNNMNLKITTHGKIWDICPKCRESFNEWKNKRKKESEELNNG